MQLLTIAKNRTYDDAEAIMSNGMVTPNHAKRQISYSKNIMPRRVYKCNDKGRPSERSTFQLLCKGDIILVGERLNRRSDINVSLLRYSGKEFHKVDAKDSAEIMMQIPVDHVEWVKDIVFTDEVQAKSSHLPKGIGWNGEHSIQYRRKKRGVERILQNVPEKLRADFVERGMGSRHSNMQQSWDKALPMPKQMNAKLIHEGIPNVHEEAYVLWILYHAKDDCKDMGKSRSEFIHHCKQSLEWTSDHLGSKVNGKFGRSIQIPESAKWAIRIIVNPYTRGNGEPRGIAWTLFKR